MMKLFKLLLLCCLLLFSGCAIVGEVKDVASKKETVALCKAADVATTITALNTGAFHETNPIMKALMTGAHGFMPFLVISAAYVAVIWWIDNPTTNMIASGITCPVAARNGYLLMKAVK